MHACVFKLDIVALHGLQNPNTETFWHLPIDCSYVPVRFYGQEIDVAKVL